jgi:formamidopyrimidine-DNA glycosylase
LPELPEVEVARKTITPCVRNRRIRSVLVARKQSIRTPLEDDARFATLLRGRRFNAVERRGKALVFHLDNSLALVFHFKLGAIVSCRKNTVAETGGVALNFTDGTCLDFTSLALSEFHLVEYGQLDHIDILRSGSDPLGRSFTRQRLKELLPPKKQLKAALTDQGIIGGIGNTWSDEILWKARLSPFRRAGDLTEPELVKLLDQIRSTLREGIRLGGEEGFTDGHGRPGKYHPVVHGREGDPCPRDGHPIEMVKKGRKTFWCPACQK